MVIRRQAWNKKYSSAREDKMNMIDIAIQGQHYTKEN